MQSRPSEPSPALSFTYCLFLDDHFPQSTRPCVFSPSTKLKSSLQEALTEVSTFSEGTSGLKQSSPLRSPARGFLSTDESNSEEEREPETLQKERGSLNNKLEDTFWQREIEWKQRESRSLEDLQTAKDSKSGFSIWSCISPDLGLQKAKSSCLTGGKVDGEKLRSALKGSHFQRIESKLRKLLDRRKRQF